ncbi:hypothetical protein CPB84DRAFT_1369612 [Gymnopilus junonius]|uniref:Uncharacterized protein n=1 Tax=Gymnopilus junonius TaxID=109634 RepID=A0A9P5NHH9_GYMJU|nr:hypothetical protein CPB84DRAFT_1369612 [Gymnopilus junonius]
MGEPSSESGPNVGREFSTSTRSSSSHPGLSRTRSSSEDSSDVLHSPVQGDYSFFPYSRAREIYQLQQQGLLGLPSHPYSASALFRGLDGVEEREGLGGGEDETERRMFSEAAMSFGQGSLSTSSGRHDLDQVSEEFALSALSNEGLTFGFGYDKLGFLKQRRQKLELRTRRRILVMAMRLPRRI